MSFEQLESLILPLIKQSPKQRAILTFSEFATTGDLDLGVGIDGQLVYMTMSRDKLKKILASSPFGIILRVFHNSLPGRRLPLKKIYGFFMTGEKVFRLSAEDNRKSNLTNSFTGESLDPEPDVEYL